MVEGGVAEHSEVLQYETLYCIRIEGQGLYS